MYMIYWLQEISVVNNVMEISISTPTLSLAYWNLHTLKLGNFFLNLLVPTPLKF